VWGGRYEVPKVLLFLIGGFGISCVWIYKVLFKKNNIVFTKADLFYFLWLGILFASSIIGVHPQDSIFGGSYRHQGVIFFLILWLLGKTISILNKDKKKLLLKMISFTILLEGFIVVYQLLTGNLYFGKPLGTLGEANAVAGFLAIGLYFVYRSFPFIFGFLPTILIVYLQSRSGILAFLVAGGSYINSLEKKNKKVIWIIATCLCLILVIVISGNKPSSFYENRITFWTLGIQQIGQKPLLGYGAESGEYVYNKAFEKSGFPLSNIIVDRSHNLFIDVAMWSGLTGLLTFLGWLIIVFKKLQTASQKFAFLSFLTYAMLQPLSIVHWILFFLIL